MSFDPNAAAAATSGVFGLPHTSEEARVILVPVPFEATTSYGGGTAGGPEAIRAASRQVDLFDVETGRPYESGIAMLADPANVQTWNRQARAAARPVIEAGGVVSEGASDANLVSAAAAVNEWSARLNGWVHEQTAGILAAQKIPGIVGGDHAVSFGAFQAAVEAHPGIGILHFDAHADLRCAYEGFTFSHASIMDNAMSRLPALGKLVQVGIRDCCEEEHARIAQSAGRIVTHFDADLQRAKFDGVRFSEVAARIVAALPKKVWISFDIDGLDPALCPHTGTPVPSGLSFAEACAVIRVCAKSGRRIVGFDLTEVAPGPDGDEWDANVGARLLYKLIGWTLVSQRVLA